jgi:hypothetical protein
MMPHVRYHVISMPKPRTWWQRVRRVPEVVDVVILEQWGYDSATIAPKGTTPKGTAPKGTAPEVSDS